MWQADLLVGPNKVMASRMLSAEWHARVALLLCTLPALASPLRALLHAKQTDNRQRGSRANELERRLHAPAYCAQAHVRTYLQRLSAHVACEQSA